MRRLAIGSVAIAVVLFASGLSAQGKPNFAGKWTLQADPNAAPAGGGGGGGGGAVSGGGGGGGGFCGMECTITQDAKTIKIERDGRPEHGDDDLQARRHARARTSRPGRSGAPPTDVHSKAKWDGNKLAITTTRDINGNSVMTKTTVSMDGATWSSRTRPTWARRPADDEADVQEGLAARFACPTRPERHAPAFFLYFA